MLPEVLRDELRAQPFVPFSIRTGDGKRYHVPHPDFTLLSPGGRTFTVYVADERMVHVDVFLITALEKVQPTEGA